MYYVILTFYRKYYNYFLKLPYGTSTCKIIFLPSLLGAQTEKNIPKYANIKLGLFT